MSYGDYMRKLHFGSVSDGIQAMKDNELNRMTNPLEAQQLGLDSDIAKLGASLQADEASDSVSKSIDDAISGGGGAIESMATMKKLYGKFKDVKSKLGDKANELKGKAQDKLDELKGKVQDKVDEANDKLSGSRDGGETKSEVPDGDNPNEFAYSSDNPGVPQAGSEVEMPTSGGGGTGTGGGGGGGLDSADAVDAVDEVEEAGSYLDRAKSMLMNRPMSVTRDGSMVGERNLKPGEEAPDPDSIEYPESTVHETGAQDISDVSKPPAAPEADHNPELAESDPNQGRQLESQLDELGSEEQSATKTLAGDTDAVEGLADGAAEAGEAAANVGTDVAEGAAEAGREAAGTALDATGIGAVVGLLLNIGGIAMGVVQGAEDSSKDDTVEGNIAADQEKVDAIKQQELSIKSQIANQTFTGANIVPNISSTTLDNVTSSSF